jgi:hypothetical protein
MLAIRIFLAIAAILVVLSLLGYAISRDPRWLRFMGLSLKGAVALLAILMILYLLERLLMVV